MRRIPTLLTLIAVSGCIRLGSPEVGGPPTRDVSRPGGGLVDSALSGSTMDRISSVGGDRAACRAALASARIEWSVLPDRGAAGGCNLFGGGTLDVDWGTVARLNPAGPESTCETALALSVWRRQSVETAAREILGSDVVQIDLMGAYSCRRVGNRPDGRISAHGRGNAIDFGGVRLRDGRRITVVQDWNGGGAEQRFLRRIHADACLIFGTVLSPEYNAAHRDHLHLEVREADWTMCR